MAMYSYNEVLTDVRQVYEQLTGQPAPKIDLNNPTFPLPRGVNPAALVQSEIDYLNLYLINSGISARLSKASAWTPAAEIYETPREVVISIELAGLAQGDVAIQAINNTLIVRGARRFRRAGEDAHYQCSERVYGAFERFFPIPAYAQPDNWSESLADGMLEIRLAKLDASSGAARAADAQKSQAQSKSAGGQKPAQESATERKKER